jgi:purine nucleosidase
VVIIDTDPGQDDAVAILLALAERERLALHAITTVAGNVGVEQTTANALRILELAGCLDVPVFPGARRPLLRPLRTAEFVCGPDGLAGADLPPPTIPPQDRHAVAFLLDALRAAAPASVTLCALGPLTNLALAFAQEPHLAGKVARIVLMGGARDLGNVTPAAEFNVHVDPHAAAIVLAVGVPIVMLGLHVTHQAMGTPERLAGLAARGTPVARAVSGMLGRPRPGGLERFGVRGHPLHDPCAVAYLLWPELFAGRDCHVTVETASEVTMGRTTIDWWGAEQHPPNVHVVDRLEADELFVRLTRSLAALPRHRTG